MAAVDRRRNWPINILPAASFWPPPRAPQWFQVYFNSSLAYGLMKLCKVPFSVAAPRALIGASNFFELAVATAIALYGPESGAALATVVGVLVEVPGRCRSSRFATGRGIGSPSRISLPKFE